MSVLFTDTECYRNFWYIGFKRQSDGVRVGFELSDRSPILPVERIRNILLKNQIVTFNGLGYDLPMIMLALEGATTEQLKMKSDAIIVGRVPWWECEKLLGVTIPRRIDHIDLMEPQPNAIASLKTLNGRLHGRRMQDLPIEPDHILTHEEMDIVGDYCLHSDTDATENLFMALKEPLELRVALGKEYGQDFRSKSDSQIGEAIVRKRVQEITGKKPERVETKPGTTFRYQIPDFMKFETPALQEVLDRLRDTQFVVKADGKVDLPAWLNGLEIPLGSSRYKMGIGGLHSMESNRAVHADDDFALVDADVASMYPAIILMLGLFPAALGKHFLKIYEDIKAGRIVAKRRGKEIKAILKNFKGTEEERLKLEVERFACEVKDKGLKIALNGVFGKLGSRFSILYAPHLLLAITLTGQLTLLMLIERAVRAGIDVVSGNTDGVLFKCPREWYAGMKMDEETGKPTDRLAPCKLEAITSQWEKDTDFELEFGEYLAIYNASVNSYFAIKADGGHKRKGPLGNPWSKHPDDYDPRAQLMKNPQATICSDAALALIKEGTPIEDTIYNCTDVKQFVSVVKSANGATWRGQYLGKTVRYYWSTDGDEILKAKPNDRTGNYAKVSKTDGSAPMMTLPDELPDDIDYARYVAETKEILMDLGFDKRPAPPKKHRLVKANIAQALFAWALA